MKRLIAILFVLVSLAFAQKPLFLTQEGDQWGPLMAAATLASMPILLLYMALQKQIIEAFMKSGLR